MQIKVKRQYKIEIKSMENKGI